MRPALPSSKSSQRPDLFIEFTQPGGGGSGAISVIWDVPNIHHSSHHCAMVSLHFVWIPINLLPLSLPGTSQGVTSESTFQNLPKPTKHIEVP